MAHGVLHGTININEAAAGTDADVITITPLALPDASGWRTKVASIWVDATAGTTGGTCELWVNLGVAGATSRHITSYDYAYAAGESFNLLVSGPIEVDTETLVKFTTPGGGAARDYYYRVEWDTAIDKAQSVFNGTGAGDDVDVEMRHLHVNNDTGDATIFESTGSNGQGLYSHGNGTGHGIYALSGAGATGDGFRAVAQSVNGNGIYAENNGTGSALYLNAVDTGNGISIPTINGHGIYISAWGANMRGIYVVSGNYHGIDVLSSGTALRLQATGNYPGFYSQGGANGASMQLVGGAVGDCVSMTTTNGNGIYIRAVTAGNRGIYIFSDGLGAEINALGGNGLQITSTGGNGHGLYVLGNGTGHGAYFLSGAGNNTDGIRMQSQSAGAGGNGLTMMGSFGHGMYGVGGGGAGACGMYALSGNAAAGGDGFRAVAQSNVGSGIACTNTAGAGTGNGIYAVGGVVAGHAILAQAVANNAVKFEATGGDNAGLYLVGIGTGPGLRCQGGATGHGGYFLSGAGATGDGFRAVAQSTNGNGIYSEGNGTGHGGLFTGGGVGDTGSGIYAQSSAGATGNGITAVSQATVSGIGFYCQGALTGEGLRVDGGATGNAVEFLAGGGNAHGFLIAGAGAGNGVNITGGATGTGIYSAAGGGNAYGLSLLGAGTGSGLYTVGGATGNGLYCLSGAGATGNGFLAQAQSTVGHGMRAVGTGTGHGFTMIRGGGAGSRDIDADEINAIGVSTLTTIPNDIDFLGKKLGGQIQSAAAFWRYIP